MPAPQLSARPKSRNDRRAARSDLRSDLISQLVELFGERVNFHRSERWLYGHDIASVPSLIRPLLGRTIPGAIVQPQSEAELVRLVQLAAEHGVALTPRGKATSGYGGAAPTRGGIVVDFFRMKQVRSIEPLDLLAGGPTVTVQPGIVWEKLDAALHAEGLELCLYPTSYPSSTVGGWLAQGGAGIGSYEYGYFREKSCR